MLFKLIICTECIFSTVTNDVCFTTVVKTQVLEGQSSTHVGRQYCMAGENQRPLPDPGTIIYQLCDLGQLVNL